MHFCLLLTRLNLFETFDLHLTLYSSTKASLLLCMPLTMQSGPGLEETNMNV